VTAATRRTEILAAPDKFRGTLSAAGAAGAIARGVAAAGRSARQLPLADGGEGMLDVLGGLGGVVGTVEVTGPLGAPATARWIRIGDRAVVEMAEASGLALAGGAAGNDPLAATTRGTGELIVAAARSFGPLAGPSSAVVVGLGGSATTDGGLGAVEAVEAAGGLGGVGLIGACDVEIGFVGAARQFGPQKGADEATVVLLVERLERLADRYRDRYGVDVRTVPGTGAAGGLGGGLVALGGRLQSGYEVVAGLLGFRQALDGCPLVVTGEGKLDDGSFAGKVVGSVVRDARARGVPVLVVAGTAEPGAVATAEALGAVVVSLTDRFGAPRALADAAGCVEEAVAGYLGAGPTSPPSPSPGPPLDR
jgi:glycerate kinase